MINCQLWRLLKIFDCNSARKMNTIFSRFTLKLTQNLKKCGINLDFLMGMLIKFWFNFDFTKDFRGGEGGTFYEFNNFLTACLRVGDQYKLKIKRLPRRRYKFCLIFARIKTWPNFGPSFFISFTYYWQFASFEMQSM